MCYVLYMASDRPRPVIAWEEASPAFCVSVSDEGIAAARSQLGKAHVHYLGSDQGCGCGFAGEHSWMDEDPEQQAATRENQRRLAAYLADCLADEDHVELFGCWSGDEEQPRVRSREIAVEDLLDQEFHFIEKEHITVRMRPITVK